MGNIIILLSSSTSAVRLKDDLERNGYSARVIQTPSALATGGCNYSVRTKGTALALAEQTVKNRGLRSGGIYLDTETEGEFRYRKLPPERSEKNDIP